MSSERYIGLISGTSRDGLDAVVVDFEEGRPDLLHAACTPYPARLQTELETLINTGQRPEDNATYELDRQLGQFFARACLELMKETGLEARDIRAIGSHGQTVWHEPVGDSPISLQLGDGDIIANVTRIPAVTDFRAADVAAGGQGAPLAPLLHHQVFQHPEERRAILNLGGIANLTLLAPDEPVSGFDTGPANCLMDLWTRWHEERPFDAGGAFAASGTLHEELLGRLLDEPFFGQAPPKSTGLETFNEAWLRARLEGLDIPPQDVQRTLAELTARTVVQGLQGWEPDRVLVCGGGVHNHFLLYLIRALLDGEAAVTLESSAKQGLHPDWVEACLFAWLARERLRRHPQDTRAITGAGAPVILGELHEV